MHMVLDCGRKLTVQNPERANLAQKSPGGWNLSPSCCEATVAKIKTTVSYRMKTQLHTGCLATV